MSYRLMPLALLFLFFPVAAQEPESLPLDRERLRHAGLATDAPALLTLLRPPVPGDGRIGELLGQLEADDYDQRHRAGEELVRLGRWARAPLEALLQNGSLDTRRQARLLLDEIDTRLALPTVLAVLRTLARQQHPQAAELILDYLPALATAQHDLVAALLQVDVATERADAALRAALIDPAVGRRAAAGLVLARQGGPSQAAAAALLLQDADVLVRLRTAQGFVGRGDERALAPLVELLGAPVEVAWQAEELLHWVAADTAPQAVLGNGGARARKECRDAWQKWLGDGSRRIDWTARKRAPGRPALYLVCRTSRVELIGSTGGVRFALEHPEGSSYADAHLLPGGRVLALDDNETEAMLREPGGRILWRWRAPAGELAVGLQPIPGEARILAVTDEQVHELDLGGKSQSAFRLGDAFLTDACLLDNGRIAALTDEGFFLVDRASGHVLAEVPLPVRDGILETGRVVGLPGGRFAIVSPLLNRVLVYSAEGTLLDEGPAVQVRGLLGAARHRDGTWLLGHAGATSRLAEHAADGRVVREVWLAQRPMRYRPVFEDLRLGLVEAAAPGFTLDSAEYRLEALGARDAPTRQRAAALLGQYRDRADRVVPALVAALDTDDEVLQTSAVRSLAQMGAPALPALLRVLRDGPVRVRLSAVQGLGQLRTVAAPAVADLIGLLGEAHSEPALRVAASNALGAIGSAAAGAGSALRAATTAEDPNLRRATVSALGNLGKPEPETLTVLTTALDDRDEEVAARAAMALGKFGPAAKPARAALVRLLAATGSSPPIRVAQSVREEAALALGEIGPDEAAAAALARVVAEPKEDVGLRHTCIRALSRLGPAARAALPPLRELLVGAERVGPLQQEAFRALVQLRHEGGLGVLLDAARNGPESVRLTAVNSLGGLGVEGHPAVETLNELSLAEKSPRVRTAIQRALKRIPLPPRA